MDSSATQRGRDQMAPKECPATKKGCSSGRTPSFSSSSSSSSLGSCYNFPDDDSPLSPATPLRFSGVPFSWEHLPGIPKKLQISHKKKESIKLLPLPPPATPPTTSKKFNSEDISISYLSRKKAAAAESFRKDPFFAALVECSKDDHDHDQESASSSFWTGAKVTRSISDRFGFINLYTSCKRTCAVSESIVYLPRSSRTANYGLINRPSR
ncbi:hypothetical protein CCACVL1_24780 [Corchorus capsularis]|uniref:Uncharacterized protein n=1 Tax=Corchorus capsularis TaxID=210143 RepID=A0A1R3GN65_COCAP|nr:hypothetical protein CCACVL1_24780 [Corchorus capsularis]